MGRFISRSTDKCLPFYNLLKRNKKFIWDQNCEVAFEKLKEYLSKPLKLSQPHKRETLILYLAKFYLAVSEVLVREDKGVQKSIYYVSKSLVQVKTCYSIIEKLVLALITSAKKMRPYFKCHLIRMVTTFPLKNELQKPNLLGHIAKWALELGELDVSFQPKTSIKSQALTDFVAELTHLREALKVNREKCEVRELMVDGSSYHKGVGIGMVLKSPYEEIF